jgi:DedD protein
MEKKTTRRIVGILVIVALVIILLPLLFTGNEQSSTRIAEMKAASVPISTEAASESLKPTITQPTVSPVPAPTITPQPTTQATAATSLNLPVPANATQTPRASPFDSAATPNASMNTQPPTSSSVVTVVPPLQQSQPEKSTVEPVLSSTQAKKSPVIDEEAQTETIKLLDNEKVAQHTEVFHPTNASNKNPTFRSHVKAAAPIADTADEDNLVAKQDIKSVKKPAWAVQLGSFKNKDNVKRLTGLLRSKGYKVFTYQAKISGQTRVCVGPEFKHTSALSLAKKLERDTKIHGIVISYNPLDT